MKMKKLLVALAFLAASATGALSQTTASQVVPGSYATSGTNCTVGPCFVPNGATNPLYVTGSSSSPTPVTPSGSTSTDISGTVTLGGSYQTVAAASSSRKNCTIQNPTTATEVLNVKFGTMTSPYTLNPGDSISALNGVVVATDAITLTAATTNHAFAGTCQ